MGEPVIGAVLGDRSANDVVALAAPDRAVFAALVVLELELRVAELFCAILLVCPNGGAVPSMCVFTLPEKDPVVDPFPPWATS